MFGRLSISPLAIMADISYVIGMYTTNRPGKDRRTMTTETTNFQTLFDATERLGCGRDGGARGRDPTE